MKRNGQTLESRGKEKVFIYGEWTTRTVYYIPNEWRFFVKVNGEFIEVFHKSYYFSTSKEH